MTPDGDIERVTGVIVDGETLPADKASLLLILPGDFELGFRVWGLGFRVWGVGFGFRV